MRAPIEWTSRAAGLLAGIAVAAGAVASWRLPGGSGVVGADIRFLAAPTGELEVTPTGPFVSATNLRAGSVPARGDMEVRNQTGATVSVRFRAVPSLSDLDDLLVIRAQTGDERLFEGTLSGLRSGSDRSLRLASGERRIVRVETWLPATVAGGYEGRVADIALEPAVEVIRP